MTATATTNARTQAEREQMLAQVQNAIGKEVRTGIPPRHHDDVMQDVQLAVWQATERFDPARGTKWSTYAIGTIKNTVANWKKHHNGEDKGTVQQLNDADLERQTAPEEPDPLAAEGDDGTDEAQLDGETMGQLATALRRGLAEGVLAQLSPGYRRLVELVAFEGLTADQIAEQLGHPAKTVRANLKGAVRRLCALGAAQHVATEAELKAVVAPREQLSAEQKERQSLLNWERGREDTKLRKTLAEELAHDGAAGALDAFGEPVKAVALELATMKLSITRAGTRLGLHGEKTRDLFRRVLAAVKGHVSELVRSELAQAATDDRFRADLNDFGPDTHAAVLAILDGSLAVDDVVELLGGKRAAVVNKLRNVAAMRREGHNAAVVDSGEIVAR